MGTVPLRHYAFVMILMTMLTVSTGNRPHCHPSIQFAQRDTPLLCGLRRSSRNVSSCFVDTGSDPSNSSLMLRTSRESAESDPELYHIFEEKATDNIVGSIF